MLVLLEPAYRFLEMVVPGGEGQPQTSLMSLLHAVSTGDTAGISGTLAQAAAHEAQATWFDREKAFNLVRGHVPPSTGGYGSGPWWSLGERARSLLICSERGIRSYAR